ncbi:hypothetical protein [Paludisphaera sp.]|uniref:hypothetical protein n=1 Tax=Paludisphaera sp. TaxID=2017432 RepID=UPI00301D3AA6
MARLLLRGALGAMLGAVTGVALYYAAMILNPEASTSGLSGVPERSTVPIGMRVDYDPNKPSAQDLNSVAQQVVMNEIHLKASERSNNPNMLVFHPEDFKEAIEFVNVIPDPAKREQVLSHCFLQNLRYAPIYAQGRVPNYEDWKGVLEGFIEQIQSPANRFEALMKIQGHLSPEDSLPYWEEAKKVALGMMQSEAPEESDEGSYLALAWAGILAVVGFVLAGFIQPCIESVGETLGSAIANKLNISRVFPTSNQPIDDAVAGGPTT